MRRPQSNGESGAQKQDESFKYGNIKYQGLTPIFRKLGCNSLAELGAEGSHFNNIMLVFLLIDVRYWARIDA